MDRTQNGDGTGTLATPMPVGIFTRPGQIQKRLKLVMNYIREFETLINNFNIELKATCDEKMAHLYGAGNSLCAHDSRALQVDTLIHRMDELRFSMLAFSNGPVIKRLTSLDPDCLSQWSKDGALVGQIYNMEG